MADTDYTPGAMKTREKFVAKFGEKQAANIEAAAESHKNGVHDKKGSDPFKWALLICIGYECISRDDFRKYHGISVPFAELREWIRSEADLGTHDGDCDYLSLMCGQYNDFIAQPKGVTNSTLKQAGVK